VAFVNMLLITFYPAIFTEERCLTYTMVNNIPREYLLSILPSVNPEIRGYLFLTKGRRPIPAFVILGYNPSDPSVT